MSQRFQYSSPNTSKWKPSPLNIDPFHLPPPLDIYSSDIYRQVFTHSSALKDDIGPYGEGVLIRENPMFEQWELEGDAALYYEVALMLSARYPLLREGGITKLREKLVCNDLLAYLTLGLNLHRVLIVGPSFHCTQKGMADVFEAYIGGLFREAGLRSTLFEARSWLDQVFSSAVFPHLDFRARCFIEASAIKEYNLVSQFQHRRWQGQGSSSNLARSFSSSSLASASSSYDNSVVYDAPPASPYLERYDRERFSREGAVSPWTGRRQELGQEEEEGDWSFDREEEVVERGEALELSDEEGELSDYLSEVESEKDAEEEEVDESEVEMDLDPASPARFILCSSSSTSNGSADVTTVFTASSLPPQLSSTPAGKSDLTRRDSGYSSSSYLSLPSTPFSPQSTPPPLPPPTPDLIRPTSSTSGTSNPPSSLPFVLKSPAIRPSLPSSSTRPLRPSPLSQGQASSTPSHSKPSTSSPLHLSTPQGHLTKPKVPSRLAQVVHSFSPSRMSTPIRRSTSTPRRSVLRSSTRPLQYSTPQRELVAQLDLTSRSPFKSTEPPINASPTQLQSLADEVFDEFRQEDEYEDMDLDDGASDSGSDVEDEASLRLGDEEQDEDEGGEEKTSAAPRVGFGFGFRSIAVHPKLAARAQGTGVGPRLKAFPETPTGTPVKEGKPTENGVVLDAVVQAAKRVGQRVGPGIPEVGEVVERIVETAEVQEVVAVEEAREGEAELVVGVASSSTRPSPSSVQAPPSATNSSHPLPAKPLQSKPSPPQHIPLASSHQPPASSSSSSRPRHDASPPNPTRSRSRSRSLSRKTNLDQDSYWSRRMETLESFRRVGNGNSSSRERERERERSPVRRPRSRSRSRSRSPERMRERRRFDSYQQEVRWRADQARERERRGVEDERSRRREDERERERERDHRGGYDTWNERRGGDGERRRR